MTPFRGTWPVGTGVLELRIELDGYQPKAVVVPLDRGVDLQFALAKSTSPPEPRRHKDVKRRPAHAPPAPQPVKAAPKEPVPL